MSRATSPGPPVFPLRQIPAPHKCANTTTLASATELISPGTRVVLVQSSAITYHAGVEMKGSVYCMHCFGRFTEGGWRLHTMAPDRRLLTIGGSGLKPAGAIKPWTHRYRCCEQSRTLGCACDARTGWVVVGTAADAIYRLGLPVVPSLDGVSVQEAARRIGADPNLFGPQLGIKTTRWLTSSLSLMATSPTYAISDTVSLTYSDDIDSRLQLRPSELEVVCYLLPLSRAVCPITCTCISRNCLREVHRALNIARSRAHKTLSR